VGVAAHGNAADVILPSFVQGDVEGDVPAFALELHAVVKDLEVDEAVFGVKVRQFFSQVLLELLLIVVPPPPEPQPAFLFDGEHPAQLVTLERRVACEFDPGNPDLLAFGDLEINFDSTGLRALIGLGFHLRVVIALLAVEIDDLVDRPLNLGGRIEAAHAQVDLGLDVRFLDFLISGDGQAGNDRGLHDADRELDPAGRFLGEDVDVGIKLSLPEILDGPADDEDAVIVSDVDLRRAQYPAHRHAVVTLHGDFHELGVRLELGRHLGLERSRKPVERQQAEKCRRQDQGKTR